MVFLFGFYNTGQAQSLSPISLPPSASPVSSGITGQSDIIPFSSGMLGDYMPKIPNLQLGFQYFFGDKVRSGQLNADYLLPVNIGSNAVVFGEAHGNYWNFSNKPAGGASNRVDLSVGGGYRKILSDKLLIGINGFYDTSRLFNDWYSSGGAGLEMAANVGANDAFDLNANWYGNIFSSTDIINAFRNQGGSYDIEAGYSHALFNSEYDLRLKAAGYQFDTGNTVSGYRTGADLTTKNGMFMLRYEYGNDRINGSWNNVGAFVNIGFQMENIIKGESPFTAPEPVFKSPRNLRRMLAQTVKRDFNQQYAPGRAALAAAAAVSSPSFHGYTTADTSGYSCLVPSDIHDYDLSVVVPKADTSQYTTLTIAFQGSVGGEGGGFQLITDAPATTSWVWFTANEFSVIITKSGSTEKFFGANTILGTNYTKIRLRNSNAGPAVDPKWCPGLVTLTWQ
jgi:hypothetical protein